MKKLMMIMAMVAVIGMAGTANAADILFDLGHPEHDLPGFVLQPGWAQCYVTGGTSGAVTLTITGVGAPALWGDDRGTAATTQGADNDDDPVPEGTYGDMYRDYVYAYRPNSPGTGMDLDFAGLAGDTTYDVTVWGYDSRVDSSTPPTRTASWGPNGGSTVNLAYYGDLGGPGPDPNTNALTDYSVDFQATTDGAGALTIEGRNVDNSKGFVANGIRLTPEAPPIPEPAGLGLIGLALLAVRRKRS